MISLCYNTDITTKRRLSPMPMDKRTFTLRLDDILFDKLKVISDKNKRSLNKQIEFLVEECIDDYEKKNGPIKIENESY